MTRVVVGAGDDAAALARAAAGPDVLLLIDGTMDALELAWARASVGPLAVERAPGGRVNAVVAAPGADGRDVEAAARFLEGAGSTTGQVLDVGPR